MMSQPPHSAPDPSEDTFENVRRVLHQGLQGGLSPSARQRIRSSIVLRAPRRLRRRPRVAAIAWLLVASGVAAAAASYIPVLSRMGADAAPPASGGLPIDNTQTARAARDSSLLPTIPTVDSMEPDLPSELEAEEPRNVGPVEVPPRIPVTANGAERGQRRTLASSLQKHDQEPPASVQMEASQAKGAEVPIRDTSSTVAEPPTAEPLEIQLDAYRASLALLPHNPAAALGGFREQARRWPASPLRHEVDLRIIQALLRLGLKAEADVEARKFLTRHPESPRAQEVGKLIVNLRASD